MKAVRTLRAFGFFVVATAAPSMLPAQLLARRVELFGTVGGVAGVAPVSIDGTRHVGVHGGFRFDGGLQGRVVAAGVGVRVWEFAPTRTFGGHGVSAFLLGEWRPGASSRNTVRATAGAGFDEIDPGRGPYRENVGTSGFEGSVGLAHEAIAPSGARVLLSADLVLPNTNPGANGRRLPVLELGFGYRLRALRTIP